jgi:hypothetical protein
MLVMLQFVASDTYFVTPDLQSGSRITSLKVGLPSRSQRIRFDLVRLRAPRFDVTAFASIVGIGW